MQQNGGSLFFFGKAIVSVSKFCFKLPPGYLLTMANAVCLQPNFLFSNNTCKIAQEQISEQMRRSDMTSGHFNSLESKGLAICD